MGEYAVTITSIVGRSDIDLDALLDVLPIDAALAFRAEGREISATFCVTAKNVYEAAERGRTTLATATRKVSIKKLADIEVHAIDWDSYERQLETSNFPDIVSAPEVAEILGVSRQRVHQLIGAHAAFPTPIVRVGSGPLWLRATIEAFNQSWVRKPGRPRVAS
jgi:predicted DNA-binding transcriptional regulator AlpA